MLKQSISLVPARRDTYQAKLLFYLFIASLTMFFLASIFTYCLIRVEAFRSVQQTYDQTTDKMVEVSRSYEPLQLPVSFWVSTLLLVATGVSLHLAVRFVRREQQAEFRKSLLWACVFAVCFVGIQSVGMFSLFNNHFRQLDGGVTKVYGMSFTLAFIHALHVIGGIVFLGWVIRQAFRDKYDHECHFVVDNCAGYWHFLDAVWILMLAVFVIAR